MTELNLKDKMLISAAVGHMTTCKQGAFDTDGKFTELSKKLPEVWK